MLATTQTVVANIKKRFSGNSGKRDFKATFQTKRR